MKQTVSAASTLSLLNRAFFPVSIVAVVLLLSIMYAIGAGAIAIQGSYALFGLVLGGGIYYKVVQGIDDATVSPRQRRWAGKGVLVVLTLSIGYTILTGTRIPVLLVGLPLGYGFVAIQYIHDQSPSRLVPQIAGVFALAPLSKYMTTAFYWGGGDLLRREGEVADLLAAGNLSGMNVLYEFFPGLHLLTGASSLVSGMPTHDSMLIAGVVTYAAVISAVYVIARQVTQNTRLAVAITVGFSFLQPLHRYTTYFFSQSLAMALIVFAFLLVFKRCEVRSRSIDFTLLLVLSAIVITHHLSLILLAPIVATLALVSSFSPGDVIEETRFVMPFVILGVLAIAYWAYRGWAFWFFVQLINAAFIVLSNLSSYLTPSSGGGGVIALGTTVPTPSVTSIVLYPTYIYLIVLLAFFAVGFAVTLREYREFDRFLSILVVGVLGAAVVFETPLSLRGLNRIRQAWLLPFAFVAGVGIFALGRVRWSRVGRVLLVGLLVVGGATGPMAAADDLGYFSQNPQNQVSYDEAEYVQMAASAEFSGEYGNSVTSLWIATQTYYAFGVGATEANGISESGIHTGEGLFLYRTEWTNHEVMYSTSQRNLAPMYVSEAYLRAAIATENKVYTTEQVGLTWANRERTVGV